MNWKNRTRNKLLSRLSGICFNTPNESGGTGNDGAATVDTGSPGPESLPGGGGQQQQDYQPPNAAPSRAQPTAERVQEVMAKDTLSFDEIGDLLRFNPPFGGGTTQPQQTQQTPAAVSTAATPPANQQQTPPANQPQQPQVSPDAQAIIAAVKQLQGGNQPQPAAPANPQPQPPKPFYGGINPPLSVSDQVIGGLLGTEDAAALAAARPHFDSFVNGLANHIARDMQTEMAKLVGAALQQVPQITQRQQTASKEEERFYSKFPELNKPAFKSVVNGIGNTVMAKLRQTNPNVQLSDKIIDAIGQLAHKQIERDFGFQIPRQAAAAPPVQPTRQAQQAPKNPAQKGPFFSGGSTRPPAVQTPQSQSADILSHVI